MGYQYLFCIPFKYTQSSLEYLIQNTNPSGNSNLSFHVGADILNLLLLYEFFMI